MPSATVRRPSDEPSSMIVRANGAARGRPPTLVTVADPLDRRLGVVHEDGLGDLEPQLLGRQAGARQGAGDCLDELRALELATRQVDAHRAAPLGGLPAGLLQDPRAELD